MTGDEPTARDVALEVLEIWKAASDKEDIRAVAAGSLMAIALALTEGVIDIDVNACPECFMLMGGHKLDCSRRWGESR